MSWREGALLRRLQSPAAVLTAAGGTERIGTYHLVRRLEPGSFRLAYVSESAGASPGDFDVGKEWEPRMRSFPRSGVGRMFSAAPDLVGIATGLIFGFTGCR